MDRKNFIKSTAKTCVLCCGALTGLSSVFPQSKDDEKKLSVELKERMVEGSRTPYWRRAEKSLSWIKNMISNMDEMLDEETKVKLLNACGRSCYTFAFGVADENKPTKDDCEGFLIAMEIAGVKIERNKETISVFWGYRGEQNPQGLSLREGYCMCPIVESDVPGLSASYCNCSAGYVGEIVERYSGLKVKKVEVLESIKRGGKDCRFRVDLINTI
jgi:hypothetical protein